MKKLKNWISSFFSPVFKDKRMDTHHAQIDSLRDDFLALWRTCEKLYAECDVNIRMNDLKIEALQFRLDNPVPRKQKANKKTKKK